MPELLPMNSTEPVRHCRIVERSHLPDDPPSPLGFTVGADKLHREFPSCTSQDLSGVSQSMMIQSIRRAVRGMHLDESGISSGISGGYTACPGRAEGTRDYSGLCKKYRKGKEIPSRPCRDHITTERAASTPVGDRGIPRRAEETGRPQGGWGTHPVCRRRVHAGSPRARSPIGSLSGGPRGSGRVPSRAP